MKYVKGIIGGFITGLVFSIPWILMISYSNFIFSFLATPIGVGIKLGYQKVNGEFDKNLPIIITSLSIIIVLLVSIFIYPLISLYKASYEVSFSNFILLYQNQEFLVYNLFNIVISVCFAFMGTRTTALKVKEELNPIKEEININTPLALRPNIEDVFYGQGNYSHEMQIVKDYFILNNATDKKSGINYKDIKIKNKDKPFKKGLNLLITKGVIRKYKNIYYYDLETELKPYKHFLRILKTTTIIMILFIIFITIIAIFFP